MASDLPWAGKSAGVPLTLKEFADPLRGWLGRTVQVDPMKPILKPPGTKHLNLECDVVLSTFAFRFNLRRYSLGQGKRVPVACGDVSPYR